MKYKVGDKVRIRSDLKENEIYDGYVAISNMLELAGEIVTISHILSGTEYVCSLGSKQCYRIKEMGCCWTDDMFEPVSHEDEMDTIVYSRKELQKFVDDLNKITIPVELDTISKDLKKENEKMENDKEMTHREKLEQRLDECRNNSIVKSVEVIVPNKVVKVEIDSCYGLEEYKLVCDPQDTFSIERAIILALVRSYYSDLTIEGVEHEADEFKFYKSNMEDLKNAMKVYKAQLALKEYDEKEKAEQERIRENKKRKKIAQKKRRAARLAEEKLKEQKQAAKIYADALKEVLDKYNIPSSTAAGIQNDMDARL